MAGTESGQLKSTRGNWNMQNPLRPLGILLLVTLGVVPAHASPILFSVSADDNLLRVVDQIGGSTISSVEITLAGSTVQKANGLAANSLGDLYALLNLSGQSGRELVTVDPATGVATSIGNTGDSFAGLAFDAAGTLYGVTGDGASVDETLFTLDLSTAAATVFLSLGNGDDGETIAFNPTDGLMYHASGVTTQAFESIVLDTKTVSGIRDSECDIPDYCEALALTHRQGDTFFLSDLNDDLYVMTTGGAASLLGNLGYRAKGLALVDLDGDNSTPVPEPGTLALLGLGFGLFGVRFGSGLRQR